MRDEKGHREREHQHEADLEQQLHLDEIRLDLQAHQDHTETEDPLTGIAETAFVGIALASACDVEPDPACDGGIEHQGVEPDRDDYIRDPRRPPKGGAHQEKRQEREAERKPYPFESRGATEARRALCWGLGVVGGHPCDTTSDAAVTSYSRNELPTTQGASSHVFIIISAIS